MKTKRIAFLTERLKSGFGVDLVVHEQATRLAKTHEVVVFAVEIEQSFIENALYDTYKLPIPLFFNPIKQDYWSWKYYSIYKGLLKRFDAFIIQTPTFNSWIRPLAQDRKVLVYYHGNSPSHGYKGLKKYRKDIFDFLEETIYFKGAHQIVTISKFLQDSLQEHLKQKVVINPHGTEHVTGLAKALTKVRKNEILTSAFISNSDKLITYVGRLDYKENPYKNTYELIRLRKFLDSKKLKNVKILAMGVAQNNIEEEFNMHNICVLPQATSEELITLLERSDLYFSPSLWEGFNLPLLEAQILGVPVVAYNLGAHAEVVQLNRSGFLVNSFEEATDKILRLMEKPVLKKKMGQQAKAWAEQFSWERNIQTLLSLL